jgi:alanine racemase
LSLIRLSKSALTHNLSLLSDCAGKAKIAAVLKDNAYGHGLTEIAALCAENGVKYAVVRDCGEAKAIAPLFDEILVLADKPSSDAPKNASFALNDAENALKWASKTNVHIKIDCGMHRNGVAIDEAQKTVEIALDRGLILRGVFSHLRSADVLSSELFWQEKNFNKIRATIEKICLIKNVETPKFHLYNSAALLRNKNASRYDFVRVGIALYGYCDLNYPFDRADLKPVLSLWGDRLSRRNLQRGDRVGYGGVFKTDCDLKASAYDIGYGDGFLRLNGLEGYETPEGKKMLGRVSMDNMVIEGEDDRVCVLNDAEKLARLRGTISYEVLARLNANIKREIVQ